MPKYKISKSNLKEFFNIMARSKKPTELEKLIAKDPILKKLEKDIVDLNKKYAKADPNSEKYRLLKKHGFLV
jgi:hypothetical protein